MAMYMTDGQEAERARIAHELHDDTVQSLVAIAQSIELSMGWIESDPTRAKMMLGLARSQAIESVNNLRRMIADLRPPALEELGIVPALHMLADDEKLSVPVQVDVHGNERRIGETHELTLFRIAQEAIRNAQRHANPTRITVKIGFEPEQVRLEIQDDGVGFDVPSSLESMAKQSHFGLLGMQERVQRLGGMFTVTSRAQAGTHVCVSLPLCDDDQPTDTVRDPVCGGLVEPQKAYGSAVYNGERYFFCCPLCQREFLKQPAVYISLST